MSTSFEDLFVYDLVKKCSKCRNVKMKTDFYIREINQKYRKECLQCTKIKQKEYYSKNREKNEN